MIAIVNYGLGNIHAFANIYKRLNIRVEIASEPEKLLAADQLILPGVGAFDWAMKRLNESGMRDALDETVVGKGKPVLGVCVGMQMMARRSDEGVLPGLGWIDAEVRKLGVRSEEGRERSEELGMRSEKEGVRSEESGGRSKERGREKVPLPHMGWNDVVPMKKNGLFKDLETGARFYFLHSYYFLSNNQEHVLALTDYNGLYASAVNFKNIFGVQFHPEKSHQWGIQLLKNFAEM